MLIEQVVLVNDELLFVDLKLRRMMNYLSPILIATLLLFSTGNLLAQKEIEKVFPEIEKVNIQAVSANIVIMPSSTTEIRVIAVYAGSSAPAMDVKANTLMLNENDQHGGANVSKWLVYVPNRTELGFNTSSGEIRAEGYNGKLEGSTGSGDIYLTSLSGVIRINTGSGNITAKGVSGSLGLSAGIGHMVFSRVSGHINANTGNGNITVSDFRSTASSSFSTGSGQVEVILAGDLSYSLSLNSSFGNARLNLKGRKINGKLLMECSEKNGEIIAPFSFDQTEVINKNKDYSTVRKVKKIGSGSAEIWIAAGLGIAELIP